MQFDPLTYKIIGCAMNVHNKLGCGFQEVIYQRALAIEINKSGITCSREVDMDIIYDGQHIGTRRADFVVSDKLIVEIKAVNSLLDVHIVQTKNYLIVYNFPQALLINFGSIKMEYKLIFNPNFSHL